MALGGIALAGAAQTATPAPQRSLIQRAMPAARKTSPEEFRNGATAGKR